MRRPGLTTMTLMGLAFGIALGVFIGEYAAVLQPIGNAFIMLLQMAVLPYFLLALILGFGRLSYADAKQLGLTAGGLLLLLWLICFIVVFAMPVAFPELESAAFFSTSVVEHKEQIDFVSLYIPANPFKTLADGVIPGIVIFGIAVGIALIGVKEKSILMEGLESLSAALTRVTEFVVKLTPIGVFALAASAAGTMTMEEVGRLQVYLISYTIGAFLLTFWLIPRLVATLTPFSYKEILHMSKDALVTGFTTGNLLIVLPLLTENAKRLFTSKALSGERSAPMIDVTIPVSFTFPNIGTLLILLFVPFAAWFSGNALSLVDYPTFASLGFLSFFGSVEIGLPFLLSQLHMPSDLFQLYIMTLVYIGRFATLAAVMHISALAVMAACAVNGWLSFTWRKLAIYAASSSVVLIIAVAGTYGVLNFTVDKTYTKDEVLVSMRWLENPLPAVVHREIPKGDKESARPNPGISRLDTIRKRGILRVGYNPESLPFSFFNANDELVGFDVEMAQILARELGVELEFIPFKKETLLQQLEKGQFDIAMSALIATTNLAERVAFSDSYLDINLGIVTWDYRRREFDTVAKIKNKESLTVAVLEHKYYGARIKATVPQATIVPISSYREFFEQKHKDVDFLFISAEVGSAWTLLYPAYSVVVPKPLNNSAPLAYALARHDADLKDFVDHWLELKKKDRTIERLYDHWVLGETAVEKEPRWSVIRNVLHWID